MDWIKIVKPQMRRNRDPQIAQKVQLFYRAHQDDVKTACAVFGRSRSYYYRWWNRFVKAGYQLSALRPLSRRPKRHPRQTPPTLTEAVRDMRHKTRYGRYRLHHELNKRGHVVAASAIVALGHTLLTIICYLLKENRDYKELGGDFFDRMNPERAKKHHVGRLVSLGYSVALEPIAAAA